MQAENKKKKAIVLSITCKNADLIGILTNTSNFQIRSELRQLT
jgi:hypothetical protein